MTKWIAGVMITVAAMAGLYAVAATTATSLAGSFTTEERTRPTRIAELETAVKRASTNLKLARERCNLFSGAEKNACNVEARAEEIHGFRSLRRL